MNNSIGISEPVRESVKLRLFRALLKRRRFLTLGYRASVLLGLAYLVNLAPYFLSVFTEIIGDFITPAHGSQRWVLTSYDYRYPLYGVFGFTTNGRIFDPLYFDYLRITDGRYKLATVACVVVFLFTRVMFIRLARQGSTLSIRGRSVVRIIAAFWAALLFVGLEAAALESVGAWESVTFDTPPLYPLVGGPPLAYPRMWAWPVIFMACWIVADIGFVAAATRRRGSTLHTVSRLLLLVLLGGALVVVVYSCGGLFEPPSRLSGWPTALVMAWAVVLWSWGSVAGLLPALEKELPPLTVTHCLACGYDLRASKDNCPECGAVIAHIPM